MCLRSGLSRILLLIYTDKEVGDAGFHVVQDIYMVVDILVAWMDTQWVGSHSMDMWGMVADRHSSEDILDAVDKVGYRLHVVVLHASVEGFQMIENNCLAAVVVDPQMVVVPLVAVVDLLSPAVDLLVGVENPLLAVVDLPVRWWWIP